MESTLLAYVKTSHPYLLLSTWEGHRIIDAEIGLISKAMETIKDAGGNFVKKKFLVWDCLEGLREYGLPPVISTEDEADDDDDENTSVKTTDPITAIRILRDMVSGIPGATVPCRVKRNNKAVRGVAAVTKDIVCFYHIQDGRDYLNAEAWMQSVASTEELFRIRGVTVVFVSPTMQIPAGSPLAHTIKTLHVPLPGIETFREVINGICTDRSDVTPKNIEKCLEALKGLTENEASDAVALSLVRKQRIDSDELFTSKRAQIESTGALRILDSAEYTLDNLGGLHALKDYTSSILTKKIYGKAKPHGVLLLGVPGTGKSHFCKALGRTVGLPVIQMDLTACRNKYVGESQRILRGVIDVLKSIGRSIVFIDEIEKQVHGGGGGEEGSNGVDSDILALMLQFMDSASEHGIFFVATCNNTHGLPPEFKRSGRWNATFFIDIPDIEQKKRIWKIWGDFYGLNTNNLPADAEWTGADIRNCCEQAELLERPIKDASEFVTPLVVSDPERLKALRKYASSRCIDATQGGRFNLKNTNSAASNGEEEAKEPSVDIDIPSRGKRRVI
jgi:hypothetical protein